MDEMAKLKANSEMAQMGHDFLAKPVEYAEETPFPTDKTKPRVLQNSLTTSFSLSRTGDYTY